MRGRGCAWHKACVAGGMHGMGDMYSRGTCIVGGVHGRGCMWQGGACIVRGAWQRCVHGGGGGGMPGGGGACLAVETETAADGMHPTGMHSCFIFTAHKRSLGQGNIFTPVCHSVNRRDVCSRGGGVGCLLRGGCLVPGGCLVLGWCMVPGGVWSWVGVWSQGGVWSLGGAWWRPPQTATAAGGDPLPPDGYCCGRYWNVILNVQKALSQPILYFSTIF